MVFPHNKMNTKSLSNRCYDCTTDKRKISKFLLNLNLGDDKHPNDPESESTNTTNIHNLFYTKNQKVFSRKFPHNQLPPSAMSMPHSQKTHWLHKMLLTILKVSTVNWISLTSWAVQVKSNWCHTRLEKLMPKLGKKFSFPLPLFRPSNLGTEVCLQSSQWETANSQVDLEGNQFQHALIKSHFLAQAQHGSQLEHILVMGASTSSYNTGDFQTETFLEICLRSNAGLLSVTTHTTAL